MKHSAITLDDKYAVEIDRVYLTGTQALVRLPLLQRELDRRAGLNTAAFISGYRGSPLGALDIQLWAARERIKAEHVHFQPGVNEESAATAIWGSQQVPLFPGAKYDGVCAMWYGKGPGVDRSGDAFKHANFAGTSPHGGVLLLAGDDHACKSSTIPHQSEPAFMAALVPVLVPADVRDILDFGLHGWAASRYSGLYIGFKLVGDVVETSTSVGYGLDSLRIRYPNGERLAPGRPGIRLPDQFLDQEHRVHAYGLPAIRAYVRENGLDRVALDDPAARFGIVTAGKSYLDVRQALADLGLDRAGAGIRLLKLALTWPIEPERVREFARGLEEILVVEEKQPVIETQLRDVLYDSAERPRVFGKREETGAWLLKPTAELSSDEIALVIARRIARFNDSEQLAARLAFLEREAGAKPAIDTGVQRTPYFCSGCPHNTSTKVPDGSRALAGIGCHFMAVWMDRNTYTYSQMGGEGATWIGQAPFTEEKHVFANIGDGTYYHSGILAIRAAVAAGVSMTYKVLFNDAVAMTGGQPMDGPLTPARITRQLDAEGVRKIYVVTDEPEKYRTVTDLAPGVHVRHRRDLELVQREFRDIPGVTAIVYDQTCASEKRRRRKRGKMVDPAKRVFINARVCEGCGDCSRTSNCLSVVPRDTEFGMKRAIDQSSCNKDYSCVEGFCPSFVTVHGGKLRKPAPAAGAEAFGDPVSAHGANLPDPPLPSLEQPFKLLVAGVGGTGVVTIGALLGVAAHTEGKSVTVLDQAGLAQKGGSVWSHVKIGARAEDLHASRVGQGEADLLLACDLVVGASAPTLASLARGRSRAVVNTHETITADFVLHPGTRLPIGRLERAIAEAVGPERLDMVDATALATALVGDAIGANPFLLGYAWQRGLVPIGEEALIGAIELNGTAVELNKAAFAWGRCAAVDLPRVREIAGRGRPEALLETDVSQDLDTAIERRAADLVGYQSRRLSRKYLALVARVRAREGSVVAGSTALTEAVARNYYKLLAYKDEYEVARLYAGREFRNALAAEFEGEYKLKFHLAPPLIAKRDKLTGQLVKREFGGYMMTAFRLLRHFKRLRGTRLDPFGQSQERQTERRLIADYEALVEEILAKLDAKNLPTATALAAIPERISGFGHVKERNLRAAERERAELLARFRAPAQLMAAE